MEGNTGQIDNGQPNDPGQPIVAGVFGQVNGRAYA
jgi:hypothetical protein